MPYFATVDASGRPNAFYNEAVHGKRLRPVKRDVIPTKPGEFPHEEVVGFEPNPDCLIPAEAVEITEKEWLEWLGGSEPREQP